MLEKQLIRYVVKSVAVFTQGGVEKVQCMLDLHVGIVGDDDGEIPPLVYELEVVHLNTHTGEQMDDERATACTVFINALNS